MTQPDMTNEARARGAAGVWATLAGQALAVATMALNAAQNRTSKGGMVCGVCSMVTSAEAYRRLKQVSHGGECPVPALRARVTDLLKHVEAMNGRDTTDHSAAPPEAG